MSPIGVVEVLSVIVLIDLDIVCFDLGGIGLDLVDIDIAFNKWIGSNYAGPDLDPVLAEPNSHADPKY